MEIVYTIYCCITDYCKISGLRQKTYYVIVSEGQESLAMCFWLRVSLEVAVKLLAGWSASLWIHGAWRISFQAHSHGY